MRHLTILISTLAIALGTHAQTKTKWFKTVRRAQAVCYAYNQSDSLIARCNAVLIGRGGQVLTQYDVLRGAVRIEVITADGRRYPVTAVAAAESLYNVARLQTDGAPSGLDIAPDAAVGTPAHIMPPPSGSKQTLCQDVTIAQAEDIDGGTHRYYTVTDTRPTDTDATLAGIFTREEECLPILTDDGALLGLTQHDQTARHGERRAYGVSARYIMDRNITNLNILSSDYTSLLLPILLPDDRSQAETVLFLMPRANASRYEATARQYISRWPQMPYGYTTLAEFLASRDRRAEAATVYADALTSIKSQGRDEVLFSQSRFLATDTATLADALSTVRQATELNPQPIYRRHEADILYALRRYDEARETYLALSSTALRSPDIFLAAAQCTPPTDSLHLCLLDSAVACYPRPYPTEALTALWLRAAARHQAGKYRLAVADYNDFEHLASGRVSAEFYYRRSESELAGRLFQQALDDAQRAVEKQPDDTELLVHLANVYLRVGQSDEARPLLRRAAELGEQSAQDWLDRHPQ